MHIFTILTIVDKTVEFGRTWYVAMFIIFLSLFSGLNTSSVHAIPVACPLKAYLNYPMSIRMLSDTPNRTHIYFFYSFVSICYTLERHSSH
jgi:hypothetical protein